MAVHLLRSARRLLVVRMKCNRLFRKIKMFKVQSSASLSGSLRTHTGNYCHNDVKRRHHQCHVFVSLAIFTQNICRDDLRPVASALCAKFIYECGEPWNCPCAVKPNFVYLIHAPHRLFIRRPRKFSLFLCFCCYRRLASSTWCTRNQNRKNLINAKSDARHRRVRRSRSRRLK